MGENGLMNNYETPERRQTDINIQHYMETLMNNTKEFLSSEISGVKNQIQSLEDKLTTQIATHEKFNEEKTKLLQQEIETLKNRVETMECRLDEVEILPVKKKARTIDDFLKVLKGVFYSAVSAGIVGFLIFLVKLFLKS